MSVCDDCKLMVKSLHRPRPAIPHKHKSIPDTLKSAASCIVCQLIISADFKWQDHDEPIWGRLDLYSDNLEKIEAIIPQYPDDFSNIDACIWKDVHCRVSEIRLAFTFVGRKGVITLAVWKSNVCDSPVNTCQRHDSTWRSDEYVTRLEDFQPCASSNITHCTDGDPTPDYSDQRMDVLRTWIDNCFTGHSVCTKSLAGDKIDGVFPKNKVAHNLASALGLSPVLDNLNTQVADKDYEEPKIQFKIDDPKTGGKKDVDLSHLKDERGVHTKLNYCRGFERDSPLHLTSVIYKHQLLLRTYSKLPRRVLDLRCDDENMVQLIETADEQAWYAALSHCWGPREKQPITTVAANYELHKAGIEISSLPYTFKEAIHMARSLDVRYLWIDSLCIIQDDKSDWLNESQKMGELYENAQFTIAAADSPDATVGCFFSDRSNLNKITMESEGHDGSTVTVHIAETLWRNDDPHYSVLGNRAWACQEWYLSRRIIFCTRGGYSWKCRHIEHNERRCFLDMKEKREWHFVLQRYSESELTYESDRLIALQGAANQLGKSRSDAYHFGVWADDLPGLFVWQVVKTRPDREQLDGVPSWSWAGSTGTKHFWQTVIQAYPPSARSVWKKYPHITDTGVLTTITAVKKVHTTYMSMDWWKKGQYFPGEVADMSVETGMFVSRSSLQTVHFVHNHSDDGSVAVGMVCFDEIPAKSVNDLYCVFLSMVPRITFDPLSWDTVIQPWSDHKISYEQAREREAATEDVWLRPGIVLDQAVTERKLSEPQVLATTALSDSGSQLETSPSVSGSDEDDNAIKPLHNMNRVQSVDLTDRLERLTTQGSSELDHNEKVSLKTKGIHITEFGRNNTARSDMMGGARTSSGV